MGDPVSIALLAAAAGSAVVGAVGAQEQGQANKKAADYSAEVARKNATIATQNANWAGQEGEAQAETSQLKNREREGAIKVNQAASGINVNSGSAADVRASQEAIGNLDTATIRSNAARKAYGFQTEATGYNAQSELDKAAGKQANVAGNINAVSTILAADSKGGGAFSKYMSTNSISAPGEISGGSASDFLIG